MRKIILIIMMILGFGIISAGIYLQIDDKNQKQETKPNEEIHITRINKFNLKTTCQVFEITENYINTIDNQKITIKYPNCFKEYLLSYWNKVLTSEDKTLNLNINIKKDNITNYMNSKLNNISSLEEDKNYDIEKSDIQTFKSINGLNVNFLEMNYEYKIDNISEIYNNVDIAVELEKNLLLTFELKSKNNIVATEVINMLINNIKIEDDKALFTDAKVEGDYQVGSIKSNFNQSYNHGYILKYKIPKQYKIVPSLISNINNVTFGYENKSQSLSAHMELRPDIFVDNSIDLVTRLNNEYLQKYTTDNNYQNFMTTGIITKKINNKDVNYFIYEYKHLQEESKEYLSTVIYEPIPKMYVKINITTKDFEINEQLINMFLEFDIEQY